MFDCIFCTGFLDFISYPISLGDIRFGSNHFSVFIKGYIFYCFQEQSKYTNKEGLYFMAWKSRISYP